MGGSTDRGEPMSAAQRLTQESEALLAQFAGTNPWQLGSNPAALRGFLFAIEQAAAERAAPRDDTTEVDRFEVIDHRTGGEGRVFVANPCTIEFAYQDGGRTLKAFITDRALTKKLASQTGDRE